MLEVFIFKACLWYSHRMAQFTALPEQLLMRPVVVVDVYIATFMLKMALGEITSVAALKSFVLPLFLINLFIISA